jgi:putative FmdB family regulatory protein
MRVLSVSTGNEHMPIYDYVCRDCGHEFEGFVRKETETPPCASCQSENLERLLAMPQVHSEGRKAMSMRAAKKRDAGQAKENAYTQRRYELHHDDH